MKKIVSRLLLFLLVFSFYVSVKATSYPVKVMIPIDTVATVQTDSFEYQDFIYNSLLDDNGQATISFAQITNRTKDKIPVSINILLFNEKQENIGFLTYCTDRDWDSDYNKLKLESNQSIPFTIKVTSRYFSYKDEAKKEKYSAGDVKYIAVLDDNKYCKVGGYDNYTGKRLEQIINSDSGDSNNIKSIINNNLSLIKIIVFVVVGFVFVAIGIFVFKLIREKMPTMSLPTKKSNNDSKRSAPEPQTSISNDAHDTGNDVIDLSYHGDVSLSDDDTISIGSSSVDTNDLINTAASDSITIDTNADNAKNGNEVKQENGESDLSNFFK